MAETSTVNNWHVTRESVLSRDNNCCRGCNTKRDLHVHHLIPRYLGGTDEAENLIALCPACHATHHPTFQVSLAKSFIKRWALRLAKLLDFSNEIPQNIEKINVALRLLGKDCFREGQMEVVLAALRGESILVIRPTGSGKSLCYQVPALMTKGTTYVFSPLKALMVDQSTGLHQNMIPSTFINSDITSYEKNKRYDLLEKKTLKFLFLTPERLDPTKVKNSDEIEKICEFSPNYLVVDEAHCVDRWGNDFRPSYGRLAEVRKQLGNPPTLAFTATAGPKAQKRILSSLGIQDASVFISDVDRPNIALIRHEPKTEEERFLITKRLIGKNDGKAMIFVPTQKIGIEVQEGLKAQGIQLPFYHGKMNAIDRDFLLGQFTGRIQPEINNIICTNAFGMGLDIPNVHLVIHWLQPESIEDYLQELGRAGRDGLPSIALIFKSQNDIGLRMFMAEMTTKEAKKNGLDSQDALSTKIENIKELDRMILDRHRCFRQQIMEYFKEDKRRERKSWAMRILEWVLCKKNKVTKSGVCCDVCNPREVKKWLWNEGHNIKKGVIERKDDSFMKAIKGGSVKWKWRPKRWWICLILLWFTSTFGALLLGIQPKTSEQYGFMGLLMLLMVILVVYNLLCKF